MTVNPHLAGDMRRDLNQLQLLYDMGELGPERFRALIRSLASAVNVVDFLVDELADEPPIDVTPAGLLALGQQLQSGMDLAMGLPVTRARFVRHLAVIDGDRA